IIKDSIIEGSSMIREDFLLEIGCEELPAKQLPLLMNALAEGMALALQKEQLNFDTIESFATPRRLAILVKQLETKQPSRLIEKKG
ncbi:glycine--tRNA ligase subunit beta, partial [Acinetobacter baumannii]